MRKLELQEVQDRIYCIFKEFDRICRKHNIKYSMEGGTLLGAVKYRDFVPWDDDIDVIMLRSEYEKFLSLTPEELGADFFLQSYLCVVPKNNLIYNIGVGAGSTHTENNKMEKWRKGKILFMPTEALVFPISHPKYVICDLNYDRNVSKIVFPGKVKKIFRKIGRMLKR